MSGLVVLLSLVVVGAPIEQPGPKPAPAELSALAAKARLAGPIASWCRGDLPPGRNGGYAVAIREGSGGGRYLVLQPDATFIELAAFTAGPDLSCYSPADARKLSASIDQSETIHGAIAPRWRTTVVCGFVDNTTAVCWQYSPQERRFVKVGRWVT
jgi:hypothetical protein